LLEVPSLLEPSKTGKGGCERNAVVGVKYLWWNFSVSLPVVNLVENALGLGGPMDYLQVIFNPHDEVILECALDGLVEKIRGKEFMNICMWEIHRERLQ
jgi:hypothetical protein